MDKTKPCPGCPDHPNCSVNICPIKNKILLWQPRLPADGGALSHAEHWVRIILGWAQNKQLYADAVQQAAWNAIEEIKVAGMRAALPTHEQLVSELAVWFDSNSSARDTCEKAAARIVALMHGVR